MMLKEAIKRDFGVVFEPFKAHAAYYDDMDYLEYVYSDVITVAERVDAFLTVLWDKNQDNVIGFKMKGLRNYFEKIFKPLYDLNNDDFVDLASAIANLYTVDGFSTVKQLSDEKGRERIRQGYRRAIDLAVQKKVRLYKDDIPLAKVA